MWLPANIIAEVDRLARIYYIDVSMCQTWNKTRQEHELRLLTGWCWSHRNGSVYRQGFKTQTVCYRDAYYTLVRGETAPIARTRLHVVRSKGAA